MQPQPDGIRKGKKLVEILQLNITALTEELMTWLLTSPAHVIVLQEHHLYGNTYHNKVGRLCKIYKVISAPATRTVGKGTTAGCMVLVRRGLHVLSSKQYGLHNTSNLSFCLLRMIKMTICIASVYLHPTDQALNINMMRPWILARGPGAPRIRGPGFGY